VSVTTDTSVSPVEVHDRRRGPWLPVTIWIVVVALGLTLVWAVPQAARSRATAARVATLSGSVTAKRSAESSAAAALAVTTAEITRTQRDTFRLRHALRRNAAEIARLQAQVRRLQARKAALSAPPPTTITTLPPIGPPCVHYPTEFGGLTKKCYPIA
jgi:uncharacterized protein HemX